jgi:hypothetical protein
MKVSIGHNFEGRLGDDGYWEVSLERGKFWHPLVTVKVLNMKKRTEDQYCLAINSKGKIVLEKKDRPFFIEFSKEHESP